MPRDPRAYLQLAEEHRRSGRHKEAIAICVEALGQHPGLDAARITLGRVYLESEQIDLARDTLQEVFARLPEHHLAGKLLAESHKRAGDLDAAAATCRALLAHYPRDREIEAILESVTSTQPGSVAMDEDAGGAADPEPEYMPEDVNLTAAGAALAPVVMSQPAAAVAPAPSVPRAAPMPAARPVTPPPAVAPSPMAASPSPAEPRSAVIPPPQADAAARGDVLQTSTLADLYLRQGLVDRAIEVYKAMLRVDPGNERARQRLEEIASGAVAAPAASGRGPSPSPGAPGPPARDPRAEAVARLEEWLETMKRGSGRTGRA